MGAGGWRKATLKAAETELARSWSEAVFLEPLKSAWRKHLIWIPEKTQALFEGVCVGVRGESLLSQSKSLIEIKEN